MFFLLSKLLFFLLHPLTWIVFFLSLWRFTKNAGLRKKAGTATVIVLLLFTNPGLYRYALLAWQADPEQQKHQKTYSTGILLTGMCYTDSKGNTYFGENTDRFVQATKLYHTGLIKKIIITGGDGSIAQNRPKEADFLYKELLAQGIPDSNILVENQSRNTAENAAFTRQLLDSLGIPGPYLLITSARHMRRATASFAKSGLVAEPHPANFLAVEPAQSIKSFLVPDLGLPGQWQYLLKEILGMLAYSLTGKA
jgi:uncharacterized SAM-binding protein YcdF (DUF218 family)